MDLMMPMPRYSRNAVALFLLAAALGGCASYTPRPLSPQATAAAFATRSLTDPCLEHYLDAHSGRTLPAHSWDLDRLTLAALYYHPDLKVARAQQNVAEAGVQVSRQRPNPSLNLTPAYNANAIAGMSPWILGTMLNFPIETAGRRGYREAQANNQLDDARFHVAEVAWQVRSHVRSRMLDYDAALREAAILKQTLALRENLLQAVQRRLTVGEAGQPEVDIAQAALADTHLQLNLAHGRIATTRVALAAAVGIPVAALDSVTLSFDTLDQPLSATQIPAPEVRRAALTNRADLLAALARYAASQSALQLEIARQYPDLQIGPGYKWDQGANKWSLGISLTLPLFNQNQGQIAQAKAQRELAAARFTALQAQAIAQTGHALADYRAALAALDSAQSLAATQQLRVQSAQRQFASGDTDRSALELAQLLALAAKNTRLTASIQTQRALGALEDAIQQPLVGTIKIADTPLPDPRRDAPAHQGFRP
jgi:cobalt-zinc-cadmium efflux system outer membrane protein